MAKLSTEDLLDAFKEMTLLELSEFVKQFEETFDVTAAAARRGCGGRGPAAGAATPPLPRSRTSSTSSRGGRRQKIQVIKEVRGLTDLGLKAKDLVEVRPKPVLEKVNKGSRRPTRPREALEAAGATVSVK